VKKLIKKGEFRGKTRAGAISLSSQRQHLAWCIDSRISLRDQKSTSKNTLGKASTCEKTIKKKLYYLNIVKFK
jgi:hypothetical protein